MEKPDTINYAKLLQRFSSLQPPSRKLCFWLKVMPYCKNLFFGKGTKRVGLQCLGGCNEQLAEVLLREVERVFQKILKGFATNKYINWTFVFSSSGLVLCVWNCLTAKSWV